MITNMKWHIGCKMTLKLFTLDDLEGQ